MPFPPTERVLYRKNPLDQVICQLRFPPILRIETTLPADFQESIRSEFPNLAEGLAIQFEFSMGKADSLSGEIVRQAAQPSPAKNYAFSSEDGLWTVSLTRTFLALSAKKYERWEGFKEKLVRPLQALVDSYSPEFFSRVGLRYIDVMCRSRLGLDGVPWRELLGSHLTGILGSPEVAPSVRNFESGYEIALEDGLSSVRIQTKFVEAKENREQCYMIDSDFFITEKTKIEEAISRLDYFHSRATRLIRWCVSERLHKAMEPEAI